MIKILIADDHPIIRKGLREIIEETSDIKVTDEACSGKEVLGKALKNDFDVVILDISLPDRSGIDVLKQLKKKKPELPVLVLSMYREKQYALQVFREGGSGYLTKQSSPDELITAIRKASLGRKYISSSLAEKLAFDFDRDTQKPVHEALSNREYEVMCMIATGKTVKEIAKELGLSVKTISTYRTRILEKMNMKNNAELTYYAIKNQLVG